MLTHQSSEVRWLLLPTLILATASLTAQFSGGPGDGFFARQIVQVTIDGQPAGTRAVYTGGDGDGSDAIGFTISLSGENLAGVYTGGPGDGFDQKSGNFALAGLSLVSVFSGGAGDGFDRQTVFLNLSGADLRGAYSGGSGDGFSRETAALTLGGESIAGVFRGSDGDGFDHATTNTLLSSTSLARLYTGGAGDGFDFRTLSATVTGQDLAALYLGGPGQGFHANYFFGVVPLPLTLISFDAIPGEQFVLVKWVTEDEVDTDFFTIERTVDGRAFATVGTTAAAGNSVPGERLSYELRDDEPYSGTSYYRLRTTDFDGSISLSHLVEVNFSADVDWSFSLFPNPNTGRHFYVQAVGVTSGAQLTIEVYDITGRQLFQRAYELGAERSQLIELSNRLTPGSYLIRASQEGSGHRAKLLLVQ
ncbi:T9SS type A sorting domain-containing protein [Lewinella sp. JB7]|uniref:T9SS type A sorting domain-containing protein n=1 Tax=Lewinella sp. JB7 TaxID=2962887 RepID=UPI0020C99AF3|nr:T9SS type A sorting domain-containing protein [Lewinella sp. JB7]MCP9235522.1 T9SS type A sorting domain-containing protein [Lewinella sp. JB7]